MSIGGKILSLTKQLYPTGRAFKMPKSSFFETLHVALALSETRAYNDAHSVLDSMIPDNTGFTIDDVNDWERRLGLISNPATLLVDREAAIIRKMNHPGSVRPRENWKFIQKQLQLAGFNVWVFENRFGSGPTYTTKTPSQFSNIPLIEIELGDEQLGDFQLGTGIISQIVNSLDETIDSLFDYGGNLRSTFFLGAQNPGDWATVPASREIEFRQLVLKLKPTQAVGFALINFT